MIYNRNTLLVLYIFTCFVSFNSCVEFDMVFFLGYKIWKLTSFNWNVDIQSIFSKWLSHLLSSLYSYHPCSLILYINIFCETTGPDRNKLFFYCSLTVSRNAFNKCCAYFFILKKWFQEMLCHLFFILKKWFYQIESSFFTTNILNVLFCVNFHSL